MTQHLRAAPDSGHNPWHGLTTNMPALDGRAACANSSNPDLWHSPRSEDIERAKAWCKACPVQTPCLTWALQNPQLADPQPKAKKVTADERGPGTVWGGYTTRERNQLARRQAA